MAAAAHEGADKIAIVASHRDAAGDGGVAAAADREAALYQQQQEMSQPRQPRTQPRTTDGLNLH